MITSDRLEQENGKEYVFRVLKENIIQLEIKPGSWLSENELASRLGISRAPVHEALLELAKAKTIEIYPQKGSLVLPIDYMQLEEVCFVRLVLEQAVVELDCEAAKPEDIMGIEENVLMQEFYLKNGMPDKLLALDNEFHKRLFLICNKAQTYSMIENMSLNFDRVRKLSLSSVKDLKLVADHRAIVEAIHNRDADTAKKIIKKHLSRYKDDENAIREVYPDYIK